jgi:spore germination protein GerM
MQAKKIICLGLIFAGVILLAGCDNNAPKDEKDGAAPAPAANQAANIEGDTGKNQANPGGQAQKNISITIYFTDKQALYLIPETQVVPFDEHAALTAVQLLIAGTKNNEHLSPVPLGTAVQSINIKDHIAYVSFNDKLTKVSGSTAELLLVGAIVNTLTEFPEIHKVQILVNDKKVATLSGHLDVSEPIERMEQIIKR